MSYFGSKFPEGISPDDYREISGIQDITCPLFRRVALKSLSSNDTAAFNCDGCDTADALIMVVNLETERMFVRLKSTCNSLIIAEPKNRLQKPISE